MSRALKSELLHDGMRVGLYGGSFDPVHKAHRHVARTALKRLNLDRIWWMVSPGNPLKTHAPASLDDRVAAVEQAMPEPRHVISTLEARLHTRTTIDLITHLQTRYPRVHFVWIMGADGLKDFHRWKNWRAIARRIPICVIARPGDAIKARLSPAARHLSPSRICDRHAKTLALGKPPGWTYLTEPLHPEASRVMRANASS
ncbi:nicotinate-nucleotide adenylyltransferase [Oceanicaulis alexandrii]|uniref:nicotinate-nucleotide adenylyltransferase n=1 Tax=Oceanicaulis alexandrii TaxID=153233 RepID=UPI0035CEBAE4